MIPDAKAPAEALSVAEVAEAVKYESVLPIRVLCSSHSDRAHAFVYLFHYTSKAVFHDQFQRPSKYRPNSLNPLEIRA